MDSVASWTAPVPRARYLEVYGLVRPQIRTNADRRHDFPALLVFRHAHQQLAEGLPVQSAVQSLRAEDAGQLALDFAPVGWTKIQPPRRRPRWRTNAPSNWIG